MKSNTRILVRFCALFLALIVTSGCEAPTTLGDAQGTDGKASPSPADITNSDNDAPPPVQPLSDASTEPSACDSPTPQGCAETGCEAGFICDLDAECAPSYCSCDEEKNMWLCSTDCDGGVCVPEGEATDSTTSRIPEPDTQTSACTSPNPVGCVETGCPAGRKCDLSVGCAPSSCDCNESNGTWECTEDCGGGTCVPKDELECLEPDPTGCMKTGCADGLLCDLEAGCAPSECWCDGNTGKWGCTADCGGGICVNPDEDKKCTKPNPVGCKVAGCPAGQICDPDLGCAPSACDCDPATGSWICTDDCNGGTCKAAIITPPACLGPNPAGCKTTGCEPGLTCDLNEGCNPTSCLCNKNTGDWECTEDCGGGTCVEPEPLVCEPGTVAVNLKCMPCEEAAAMAEGQFAMAQDKYAACVNDTECIAKDFPSSCGEGCPVAMNEKWATLYEKFVENTANVYCTGFMDACEPEPPVCSGGEAFCSDGHCALKEGD